jgi:hypothetical protein
LKNNASKLLLAVMESRGDSENAERILYNMNPRQLVDVACKAYHQKLVGGEEAASPKEVGHNIYILCHQLAQHNKELAALMKPPPVDGVSGDAALQYYANHTAQIEIVRHDRTMEQIVFPIPEMCEYLTNDTKVRVFHTAERDDQGSKVAAFFEGVDDMFDEMKWQKKLRGQPFLFWVSSHMSIWSQILFNLAVIINLIVAFFYPFDTDGPAPDPGTHLSGLHNLKYPFPSFQRSFSFINLGLIWAVMLLSAAVAITLPKPSGIRTLVMTVILRLICSAGPQPTLMLLGTATVVLKGVHLLSIMGNAGTFQRSVRQICTDTEIVYHVVYLIFCFLGLSTHPFFFSVLLFDVVYREETLLNVIRSVTRNGRSIVLTAVLALILVYMFSIIGYFSFMSLFHVPY